MSFSTKKYTISLLINEVSSLKTSQVSSIETLAITLSPRAGRNSAKFFALNQYLNGNLSSIFAGKGTFKSYGKTPRARVLNALRNRKNV